MGGIELQFTGLRPAENLYVAFAGLCCIEGAPREEIKE
jgi:hypothetical protein